MRKLFLQVLIIYFKCGSRVDLKVNLENTCLCTPECHCRVCM